MTFAAQYPGKCSACGDLFPEGTHIRRDETRGYRHADCDADDSVTPQPVAREVCDRCWLEKSITGECGCEP